MGNASNNVTPKKRGRPATGRDPTYTIRLHPELTARVEAWAKLQGLSRSEAIRRFIEGGLGQRKGVDALAKRRHEEEEPENSRTAYWLRVDQALQFAKDAAYLLRADQDRRQPLYGPTEEIIAAARQVAAKWTSLAKQLEKTL